MFCTQCGAPLQSDALFCGNCGWRRSTSDAIRAEVEAREARGLKLCVKCRSEIPLDAAVCHRCDAPQPGSANRASPLVVATPPIPQSGPMGMPETAGDFRLAGVGLRIGAYIIDVVVLFVVSLVIALVIGSDPESEPTVSELSLYVVVVIGYFVVAEALTGQTVGKRLTGIRVVTESGESIGWGKSAGRNLLRIVDSLPALYIVGLIVMSRSPKMQRIGDRAAGTIVILSDQR